MQIPCLITSSLAALFLAAAAFAQGGASEPSDARAWELDAEIRVLRAVLKGADDAELAARLMELAVLRRQQGEFAAALSSVVAPKGTPGRIFGAIRSCSAMRRRRA